MNTHNQLDPKWRGLTLGRTWATMARYGCATFALSMMSERFGCYRSPEDIAKNPRHYNTRALILWKNVAFDKMVFEKRLRKRNYPAIDASLAPGRGVLVEVNWAHWLLVLEKDGNDYIAIDPLGGQTVHVIEKYGRITGSVHYTAI